jgi:acyl-CoA reductase-like NAD-dependent aldehyde dehydrogenase
MGPLVSQEQLNRVCSYLEAGLSEGAEAVVGGKSGDGAGLLRRTNGDGQDQSEHESGT